MNANLERLSENSVKLTVEVSAEEFDKALDLAFEKVVKEVKADGFRPGKMPKNIFIQRFGWASLYNEAIQYAFEETYPLALQQTKVYPTAEPKVDLDFASLEKGKSFTYTAEVDVWPEVHLGEYKGLKVKPLSTRVTKKDVEAEIKHMLESKVENVIKDGPAENGDTVVIDFEGFVDGVAFEGGKGENYDLTIGSNTFIPGFEDQLVGANTGDHVEVKVTFPEEYQAKELAGKEAVFQCDVKKIETKEVPELDDEFAKDVSEFDTLAEYKEDVKKNLTEKKEKEARTAKENAAVDKAIENAQMDIPDLMIQTQCRQMMDDFARRMQQQGLSMDQYFQFTGQSMDKMMEDMKPQALKRIQTRLVLEKIAETENTQPSEEEITEEIQKMADAYKMEADKIREAIGEDGIEQLKKDLSVQKAVTLIADAAVEAEKAADAE